MLKDTNARNKRLYIAEATLEYIIALLVEGAYLSRMTMAIGLSDTVTGIIHSILSLGNLFGLISMLITKRKMKKFVIGMSIANQLMFMLLYVIPITGTAIPKGVKSAAFIILIIGAYLIYYIAHPKKINWLMSSVKDSERGSFTANKEIVSLVAGIAFNYLMGFVVDYYVAKDELKIAFIICGAVIFISSVFHTLMLFLYPEKEVEVSEEKKPTALKDIFSLFKDKSVMSITVLFAIWYFAQKSTGAYLSTYELKELQFTQTFIAILTSLSSVARILFSRYFGRYADRHGFASLLRICFAVAAVAYAAVIFATPTTGKYCFVIFKVLTGVSMAGINSSVINLVYDLVAKEKRANALALTQAVAGTVGFLSALIVSPLVSYIQNAGNKFLGVSVYAQQVLAIITTVITIIALLYVQFVLMKIKKADSNESN